MEWKKVKWLIIALLLAVNIFLGINITVRYTTAINHERQDLESALKLVSEELGFSVNKFEDLPRYLYSFFGVRDLDGETKLAKKLMGDNVQPDDMGGGVFVYSLPTKERLIFRRGGAFEGIIPAPDKDPNEILTDFFNSEKISYANKDALYTFSYDGVDITNASLSFLVSGDYMSVNGILPLAEKWEKSQKSRSRGEMVLALSKAMTDNEMGSLYSVKAVYFLRSEGISDLKLMPAWLAICNEGTIVISIDDKSVLSVEK